MTFEDFKKAKQRLENYTVIVGFIRRCDEQYYDCEMPDNIKAEYDADIIEKQKIEKFVESIDDKTIRTIAMMRFYFHDTYDKISKSQKVFYSPAACYVKLKEYIMSQEYFE